MAKHCKVCNNSYPDTEEHCPHCAAATTQIAGSDSAVLAGGAVAPRPAEEDSSAVNLGEPVVAEAASPSGESDQSWAALVADAGDSAVGGEPFVAEVASGAELPGATVSETPSAHLPGAGSDSAVGGEPLVAEVASSGELAGGPFVAEVDDDDEASAINLGELATQATGGEGSASGEAMLADEAAEVEAGSAVNLGEVARPTDRPSSRDLIAEAVESGVDLAGKRGAEEPAADADLAEEGDSAIELSPSARAPSPSSAPEAVPERRRVPPGSESDIDLEAAEAAERIDLTARAEDESAVPEAAGPGPGSSGVDLGGVAGRPPKRLLGESSSSAVEMGEGAAEDEEAAAAAALAGDDEGQAPASSVKSRTKKVAADEEQEEEAAPPPPKAGKKTKDEEEEEEPAAKKPKARAGCGSLVGVGVLGLLIGAVVPIALAMFNVVDAGKGLGSLAGMSPKTNAPVGPGPANVNPGGPKQPVVGVPTVADAGQHLKNGDFAKAMEGLGSAGDGSEVQAQRGTARWMNYLQDQMGKGAKPNGDDESVKKARAELEAAKDNPEAILALGNLEEYTAGPAAALKTYQDAATRFTGKPWARVFQAQINRLQSASAGAAGGNKPQAAAPRPGDGDISARALVMLLIAFQPAGGDAAGDKVPEEAGFDFWAAVKSAKEGNYPEAIKELDAARAAHDKLRFSRLRKAQNPLSDPTEEIFLRATAEIKAYWTLQNSLAQQGIAGRTPAEVQKALEALTKQQGAAAAQLKAVADKLKTTPDKAAGAIDTLVKERGDAAKKATALETDLTAAKKDADAAKKLAKDTGDKLALAETQLKGSETKLKAVNDRLAAAGVKDADPAKGIDSLAAERATADKALDAIVAKVALAHVKVDRKDVLRGVNSVVEAALVNDPKGELMASREEIRRLGGALNQRRTPEQMLDIWMPIIADRGHKDDATKATVDAERVRTDDRATPLGRKKAAAVLGLAKRDQGDMEGARTLLGEALAGSGPKAAWQEPAAQALKELTDPTAYYLPRARELYEDGKYQEAMVTIAEARKLFPKDAGNFQALSGLIQLDMARAKGKLDPASPAVIEAKRDATAAAAAGSAEGNYALGRINEELGNLAEAKAAYAKALAAHGDNDATGARYRLALARVLKLQGEKPAGGHAAAALRSLPVADMRRQPLLTLVLLVELGMQPGAVGADQDEATRLLREVENAKDGPDTFMLKAQALALRGLWTPALKTYAAGLRPHLRRDYADGLADLLDRTPALRRPAAMDPPNPLLADASYASGLRHYFARRYGDAEESFLKAIEYDNQDARYFYFLGLSRLALNKTTDAEADFHEGAQLESLNRPGREAISSALERVQGAARQAVNRARP